MGKIIKTADKNKKSFLRVLLLNAPIPKRKFYVGIGLVLPPAGLLTLAGQIKHNHEVKAIDTQTKSIGVKKILAEVRTFQPDVIGISTMTFDFSCAIELAKKIKKFNPRIVIVLGGPHVSFLARETLQQYACVDYVVRGEGELVFQRLLSMLENKNLKQTAGLCFRDNEKIVDGGFAPRVKNLDKHILPFDLLEEYNKNYGVEEFLGLGRKQITPQIPLFSSRGCPFHCNFCSTPAMFQCKVELVSIKKIIRDIKYFKRKFGINYFGFQDDLFTTDNARLETFCREILQAKLNISWWAWARVDWASRNPDVLKLMQKSGCRALNYGIESSSPETLKKYNKSTTVEQIRKAIEFTRQSGISPMGTFILGEEDETEADMQATIDFAKELNLSIASFNILAPLPGTVLYDRLGRENKILTKDWKKYDNCHAVIKNKYVSPAQVEKMFSRAYREFYLRKSYIRSLFQQEPLAEMASTEKDAVDRKFIERILRMFRDGIRREERNIFGL